MTKKEFIDNTYTIVEDGMLATQDLGEGRFVPGVVIKSKYDDKSVRDLMRIHKRTKSGDATTIWARPDKFSFKQNDTWWLIIKFTNPMNIEFMIEFSIKKHFPLIDSIVQSKGVYFSVGEEGDKFSAKLRDGDLILVEVPRREFNTQWNSILRKYLTKKYRKMGVKKKGVNQVVSDHIKTMRSLTSFRVKK